MRCASGKEVQMMKKKIIRKNRRDPCGRGKPEIRKKSDGGTEHGKNE
jgi:hypothetical protein